MRNFCGISMSSGKWGDNAKFEVDVDKNLNYITLRFNDELSITVNQEFFTNNIGASEELRRVLGIVRDDIEFSSKEYNGKEYNKKNPAEKEI